MYEALESSNHCIGYVEEEIKKLHLRGVLPRLCTQCMKYKKFPIAVLAMWKKRLKILIFEEWFHGCVRHI